MFKFRTGDIFYHTTTDLNDLISEYTIGLIPGHSAVVLVGKEFETISTKGSSPTDTYVVAYPSHIWPLEYFIHKYWYLPNSNSMTLVRRLSGREITGKEALNAWERSVIRERNGLLAYQRKILAYFKLNRFDPDSNINSCSELGAIILQELGLISPDAITGDILPDDILRCRFYQTERYEPIMIFNKKLNSFEWLLTSPLIRWGFVDSPELRSEFVEKILSGYLPPKKVSHVKESSV